MGRTTDASDALPVDRLASMSDHTAACLVRLAGRDEVVADRAELWSPRKVLRCILWHRRHHSEHVRQLRQRAEHRR